MLHPHYKAWLKANGHWQTAVEAFAMHGRPEYLEGFRAAVNPLPEHAYFDGWVGDRTVELIRRHPAEQPLFLFMGLPNPHIPFDAPEPYASMYDADSLPLPPHVRDGAFQQAAAAPRLQALRPQGRTTSTWTRRRCAV